MTVVNYIVSALILIALTLAAVYLFRHRGGGKGGCAGCPAGKNGSCPYGGKSCGKPEKR